MATYYGTNNPETIYGSANNDTIYGYGGGDWLYGLGGNDDLYGGSGNDRLFGGNGYNDYIGGSGYDWFSMSQRGAGFSNDLIVDFQFDVDRIDLSGWGVSDFSQVLALLSSSANGSAALNAYWGGYAHVLAVNGVSPNELIASDFVFANTSAKNEAGTNSADVMFGSRYNDNLYGYGGADRLLGGQGNDYLVGGLGSDVINGGIGTDVASYYLATSGVTADLQAPSGNTGEAAGDTYSSIEQLVGTNYADSLRGNSGANALSGLGGSDYLYGRNGNDTLRGGNGNDVLIGGIGADALFGEGNDDWFRFDSTAESPAGPGRDVIYDFDDVGNDALDLSQMPGVSTYIGSAGFTAAGQMRAIQSGAHVLIQINTIGTSGAESEILLANTTLGTGVGTFGAGDFLL